MCESIGRRGGIIFKTRIVMLLVLLQVSYSFPLSASADLILYNGAVVTLDSAGSITEAVAVEDGRIIFTGSQDGVRGFAGGRTEWIDLQGAAVLPGFIDAHGHFPATGLIRKFVVDVNSPPIGRAADIADVIRLLKEKASKTPDGEWVRGIGYDDTMLKEKRHLNREDLDKVSTRHPVYVSHISGHLAAVNSLALETAGIGPDTTPPEGGVIQTDPGTEEPNGVLEETAMTLVSRFLPQIGGEDFIDAIGMASDEYAARGVTMAQSGASSLSDITHAIQAHERGLLSIRMQLWPRLNQAEKILSGEFQYKLPGDDMISVRAFKAFSDGSIQGYTGYLRDPYHVHTHKDEEYRGYPRTDAAVLNEQVRKVHDAGWQLAVHANGDAAIDTVIDAFEYAQRLKPRKDARHVVIHAQMAREEQLNRMYTLGIIPSFFVLHTYYWGDRHRDIFIGPDRAARISPVRSAEKKGLIFTLHADTPVVPMEPLRLVWSAVNRLTTSGKVLGPGQRVSVETALRGVTAHAAYQNFDENRLGSIEAGKLADLVVLDRNPLEVDPLQIADIKVLRTFVSGRTVYPKPGEKESSK